MTLLLILGIAYLALVFGGISWMRWRRKSRWPFKDTDKLLRSPGESLRRRLSDIDEQVAGELAGGIIGSLLGYALFGLALGKSGIVPASQIVGWSIVTAALVQIISAWRLTRLWRERTNTFVGWYGERFTANYLRPLERCGYYVFHDVPFSGATGPYNIDHVVVGPTGVAIVEVKTPRKGNPLPGRTDHEVTFDGDRLIWPWGEDRRGIQQTENAARSLAEWLHERTGLKVSIKRVLTFPSWYVHEKPNPNLRVVQTKFLPDAIRGRGELMLTPAHVDLIARQLELQCRDVVD